MGHRVYLVILGVFVCDVGLAGGFVSKTFDPCFDNFLNQTFQVSKKAFEFATGKCSATELKSKTKDCIHFPTKLEDKPEIKEKSFEDCLAASGHDRFGRCPSSNLTESDIATCFNVTGKNARDLYADFVIWREDQKSNTKETQCLIADKCGEAIAQALEARMEVGKERNFRKRQVTKSWAVSKYLDDCGTKDPQQGLIDKVQKGCGIADLSNTAPPEGPPPPASAR